MNSANRESAGEQAANTAAPALETQPGNPIGQSATGAPSEADKHSATQPAEHADVRTAQPAHHADGAVHGGSRRKLLLALGAVALVVAGVYLAPLVIRALNTIST